MKIALMVILLLLNSLSTASAVGISHDPIERMASGAIKGLFFAVVVGVAALFTNKKNK